MSQRKLITWAQLKARIDTMTTEQLAEPVIWWGEEKGGFIASVSDLEEDYYKTDEGMQPRSSMNDEEFAEYVTDPEDFMEKGFPILWID